MLPFAAVFAAAIAFGALAKIGVPPHFAVGGGVVLAIAGLAAVLAHDLRRHPAGTLRIEEGQIQCDAWAGTTWNVPIENVRVVRHGGVLPVLAVHFSRGPTLYVHQARLGVSLAEVEAAIFEHLGVPAGTEPRAATTGETFRAYGTIVRRRWWVIAVALAVFALMSWVAARGAP